MNYLAHIYLARQNEDSMVGALLGDFTKSDKTGTYGEDIEREIRLHRKVDSFTDNHPVTREARQLFRSETRRFAGISLDVFYDHLLATHWEKYSSIPLEDFVQQFYKALLARRDLLPEKLAFAAVRMVDQDWLGSYKDFAGVEIAITRISGRLSRSGDLLRASLVDLEVNYEILAEGFHVFFPELIAFIDRERANYAR